MRKQLIASVVILLLTNVVVLAGVFYNRSGGPLFSIELTERELPLVQSIGFDDENSGTGLLLRWQIPMAKEVPEYFYNTYSTPVWLDDAKIIELGFDIEKYNSDTEKYQTRTSHLSREVVMVLEYQGDSYQRAIALAEKQLDQAARDACGWDATGLIRIADLQINRILKLTL